ncbi:MAG: DUF1990 domain-containing protein [Bacteroidia bacterium]|nr:DUF1990 domain-containing protein [Bacteroidia bacterium]
MLSLRLPSIPALRDYLARQAGAPLSYPFAGGTQVSVRRAGYDHDCARIRLGNGPEVFEAASKALQAWEMFPAGWTRILPADTQPVPGVIVAMYAHFLGVWWRNSCQVVYVIRKPDQVGFAYGTLPDHMERGEELFCVQMDAQGDVWYEIQAISTPQRIIARLAYPLLRLLQARFRRESCDQMLLRTRWYLRQAVMEVSHV